MRCCAVGCNNVGNHLFPKCPELRKQWESAMNIKGFRASNASKLCSAHFTADDYIKEGYYSGLKLEKKVLKKGTVPTIFLNNKPEVTKRTRQAKFDDFRQFHTFTESKQSFIGFDIENELKPIERNNYTIEDTPKFRSIGIQHCKAFYTVGLFKNDDKGIQFYTGLRSFQQLMFVLFTLNTRGRSTFHWNYITNVSNEDQFFITLMKLRRNTEDYELGRFFEIEETAVKEIFIKWINFMHHVWTMQYNWSCTNDVSVYKCGENTPVGVNADCNQIILQSPSETQQTVQSYNNQYVINLTMIKLDGEVPSSNLLVNSLEEPSNNLTLWNGSQLSDLNIEQQNLVSTAFANFKILNEPVHHEYVSLWPKIQFVCEILCKFLKTPAPTKT